MHKTIAEARAFIEALLPRLSAAESIDLVICPAYLALRPMVDWTRGSRVEVYAQNMHYAPEGPFTGEVSAPMLLEAGVRGVIVGHSERRRLFAESDAAVQLKVARCGGHRAGADPVRGRERGAVPSSGRPSAGSASNCGRTWRSSTRVGSARW